MCPTHFTFEVVLGSGGTKNKDFGIANNTDCTSPFYQTVLSHHINLKDDLDLRWDSRMWFLKFFCQYLVPVIQRSFCSLKHMLVSRKLSHINCTVNICCFSAIENITSQYTKIQVL